MDKKINLIAGAALLIAAGIICGFYASSIFSKPAKIAAQDAIIKSQVQQAVSMLDELNKQAQGGQFSVEYAKSLGADILRSARYGENNQGYFWADTDGGVNVVLYGRQDVEGKNRLNDNVNGIYYVKEIIKNGKLPGGGYTDYFYTKMAQSNPEAKRGYSLYFAPFGWVVGTGYYLSEVQ